MVGTQIFLLLSHFFDDWVFTKLLIKTELEFVAEFISVVVLNMKAFDLNMENYKVFGVLTAVAGVTNTLDLYRNASAAINKTFDSIMTGEKVSKR